ncbi:hypothetical protein T05_4548 [Trichinella murrelli]|uniref:Uncharacterized protein n=1 Tax=Trichinella murrelli TaxID=144512 RepID=A0A0V0TCT8_9BILA|nr:hypothetical protein T05_4548 [Trichinella murrelli]
MDLIQKNCIIHRQIFQLLDVEWDKEIFLENQLVDLLMIHKEHREIPNPGHHQYLSARQYFTGQWLFTWCFCNNLPLIATPSGLSTDSCSCGNFNLLHLRKFFPFLPENLHFPYLLKHCYNFTKNLKNYNDLRLIGFSETRHNPFETWFFINHTCIQLHTNKKERYLP